MKIIKVYDIYVSGKIRSVCGNFDIAKKERDKLKQSGYKNVEIKEREVDG